MEVILGTIVTTFGIKGEVKVHSNTDFAKSRYKVGNEVILYSPINQKREVLKISSRLSLTSSLSPNKTAKAIFPSSSPKPLISSF